jgi:hypothetical protein
MSAKNRGVMARLIQDDEAERVARILGDSCAMAHAIRERDRRRATGEDAHIFQVTGGNMPSLLVGPMPREPHPSGGAR